MDLVKELGLFHSGLKLVVPKVYFTLESTGTLQSMDSQDFPGYPVVKTLCFQCKGHGFDPWSWD